MANIDVIYNGDKIVMRLVDLDVNYPRDDRIVTYKIINYAINGGAVTISRQTTLPARVVSGAEITLYFDDLPALELTGGLFEPFEEGSTCEIIWTCTTTGDEQLASGSSSIVCQGEQPGIDIAKATIIPYPNGNSEFTIYIAGAELGEIGGTQGTLTVTFRINGTVTTVETTLRDASVPNQEMTYFVNAYLPQSGDLYVNVRVVNPDGVFAERDFYFQFDTNLAPVINKMSVLQINAANKEISVTWNATARGNYRWAITAKQIDGDVYWQKASSGTDTIPSGQDYTVTGITFDEYARYNIMLWVYYDYEGRTYTETYGTNITLSQYPNSSAQIELLSRYENSVQLRVTGLDVGYTGTDRYAIYKISTIPNIVTAEYTQTVPLEGGVVSGATVNFYNLPSRDTYYCWCDIYNGSDEIIKTLPMLAVAYGGFNVTITQLSGDRDVLMLEWDCPGVYEMFFDFDKAIRSAPESTGKGEIIASNPTAPPAQQIFSRYYSTSQSGTDYIIYPHITDSTCDVTITIDPFNYIQDWIYIGFSIIPVTPPYISQLTAEVNGISTTLSITVPDGWCNREFVIYVDGTEHSTIHQDYYMGDNTITHTLTLNSYGEHTISVKGIIDDIETEMKSVKVFAAQTGRPEKFEWDTPKVQGGEFNLDKGEINRLMDNINAVRVYRGLDIYPFTYVVTGDKFTANTYNSMVSAIQGVSGYGTFLYTVVSGLPIEARHLNLLRDELNAIE